MLFSVDQRYYMYIVMWCWSTQIYKHARCQLVKCMNLPASLDYKTFWKLALPGKIFLKACFVINDFSDIVFFKKRFIPHMEVFSLRAPSSFYFGISNNWQWMGVGCEYLLELHTQIKSARTSVFILTKSDFQLYVQPNSLDGPLIGTTCTLLYCNVPVSCLKQIACALKSKSLSS